jgi:hypothetical protein
MLSPDPSSSTIESGYENDPRLSMVVSPSDAIVSHKWQLQRSDALSFAAP